MTIADKLRYLGETKTLIKEAIQNKGVTVTDSDPFRAYAEKISQIQTGGGGGHDTVWAYYAESLEESKKVFMTKALNIMTPSSDFANGFYPLVIFNGFAYGQEGDPTGLSLWSRRQIINGAIDQDSDETIETSAFSVSTEIIPHYGLNGSFCACFSRNPNVADHFSKVNNSNCGFIEGDRASGFPSASSIKDSGVTCTEKAILFMLNSTTYYIYRFDMETQTVTKMALRGGAGSGFCFMGPGGDEVYRFHRQTSTAAPTLIKQAVTSDTTVSLENPTVVNEAGFDFFSSNYCFFQTRDYKFLLHTDFYVTYDVDSNTISLLKYPKQILDVLGDRLVHSVQVLYNNQYVLHLEDGTTLLCKYTNDIQDTTFEVIAPLQILGKSDIYYRALSPYATYWWVMPRVISGAIIRPGVADGPADVVAIEKAETEYHAYNPVKERFNSTVISGFATGESKSDAVGRLLIKVKSIVGE